MPVTQGRQGALAGGRYARESTPSRPRERGEGVASLDAIPGRSIERS